MQRLGKEVDLLRSEVAAQQLALAHAAAERDGARSGAAEAQERLKVSHFYTLWCHFTLLLPISSRCGALHHPKQHVPRVLSRALGILRKLEPYVHLRRQHLQSLALAVASVASPECNACRNTGSCHGACTWPTTATVATHN